MEEYPCLGRGCDCADGRRRETQIIEALDIRTKDCLAQMVTAESWDMMALYQHYKMGFLPFEGGIMSQPQVFADAMRIIEAEVNSG